MVNNQGRDGGISPSQGTPGSVDASPPSPGVPIQSSLWPTGPMARWNDPETSFSAATSLSGAHLSNLQSIVLAVHRGHPEGLTDGEMVVLASKTTSGLNDGSLRKRRCELFRGGLLDRTDERRNGMIVWRVA